MAGIGFQLRKVIDSRHGLLHSIKSYGFAVVTINGPMVLCIVGMSIIRIILGNSIYSGVPSERILTTITYSFIVATIITGGFSLVLTRYVSDCIYKKDYSKVVPSFYGGVIFSIILSIAVSSGLVVFEGMKVEYGLSISILFSCVSIIWVEMIYLSAVKNYKAITKGFFLGNAIVVFLMVFIRLIPQEWQLHYIFLCFNTGFSIAAALLMRLIVGLFGEGTGGFIEWTKYFKKFPSLSMMGIFYYTGLYFACIYFRFTDKSGFVDGFMVAKSEFDIPFYLAVLGIIPGLVYFVVRLETALHTECTMFYSAISKEGTYDEINFFMKNVISTVKQYYIKLGLVQGIVLLIMLLIPFTLIQNDEMLFSKYAVFWVLTIGMSATLLMYVAKIVILYFDGRLHALRMVLVYMILNVILTLCIDNYVTGIQGTGFMISSIISMLVAVAIMVNFLRNLMNNTFIMK